MKKWRLLLAAATSATILFASVASACPRGYVPCGEKQQLCCPMR